MITIEVRRNGKMIGFAEPDSTSDDPGAWRYSIFTLTEGGFPSWEEAVAALFRVAGIERGT
jgi:hypothetical protein